MTLEHAALVTSQIERLKDFYVKYFDGTAERWSDNEVTLYFISFGKDSTRLELEQRDGAETVTLDRERTVGLAHLAFLAKSRQEVIEKTRQLEADGYEIRLQPTAYGQDFFESSFLDPDGNLIELSVGPEFVK